MGTKSCPSGVPRSAWPGKCRSLSSPCCSSAPAPRRPSAPSGPAPSMRRSARPRCSRCGCASRLPLPCRRRACHGQRPGCHQAGPLGQDGPAATIRVLAALLFGTAVGALHEMRSRRPDIGCGCFGDLSDTPVSVRTLARSALLCVAAIVSVGVPPLETPASADQALWLLGTGGAELALIALLSPEVGEIMIRLGYAACEARQLPVSRTLAALRGSGAWRHYRPYLTAAEPGDVWREGCWRFAVYPAVIDGTGKDVVFAVYLQARRPPVSAAIVDAVPVPRSFIMPAVTLRRRSRPQSPACGGIRGDPGQGARAPAGRPCPGLRAVPRPGAERGTRPTALFGYLVISRMACRLANRVDNRGVVFNRVDSGSVIEVMKLAANKAPAALIMAVGVVGLIAGCTSSGSPPSGQATSGTRPAVPAATGVAATGTPGGATPGAASPTGTTGSGATASGAKAAPSATRASANANDQALPSCLSSGLRLTRGTTGAAAGRRTSRSSSPTPQA